MNPGGNPRSTNIQTIHNARNGFFGTSYAVLEYIMEGSFGKVARCRDLVTKEEVAVKILRPESNIKYMKHEVSMLELISKHNPDSNNLVKFFERFEYLGHNCLVFEMLDCNLSNLLERQQRQPLALTQIRPIAQQLFVALDLLKNIGVLHTDIKPDNIVLVNNKEQPLRIKLVDFGLAISRHNTSVGMDIQPTGYRAPEISLGLPFSEAIDVWGVGCILAFLYMARPLFPVTCDFQMMKSMVQILGQPEGRLLLYGKHTFHFFTMEVGSNGTTWKLKSEKRYKVLNKLHAQEQQTFLDLPRSLDDLVNLHPAGGVALRNDALAFVDLMKNLLHLKGECRISAARALQHPFVTMSHLTEPECKSYLDISRNIMAICPGVGSEDKLMASGKMYYCDAKKASVEKPATCSSHGAAAQEARAVLLTHYCPVV